MKKSIQDFQREVFESIRNRRYVILPPALHERFTSTIKLRFRIEKIRESFIQFYYNEENGKTSMALIIEGKRIYGHDYTPDSGWHRHLPPNGNHDYSKEGRKPMAVENFLRNVDGIIKRMVKGSK